MTGKGRERTEGSSCWSYRFKCLERQRSRSALVHVQPCQGLLMSEEQNLRTPMGKGSPTTPSWSWVRLTVSAGSLSRVVLLTQTRKPCNHLVSGNGVPPFGQQWPYKVTAVCTDRLSSDLQCKNLVCCHASSRWPCHDSCRRTQMFMFSSENCLFYKWMQVSSDVVKSQPSFLFPDRPSRRVEMSNVTI